MEFDRELWAARHRVLEATNKSSASVASTWQGLDDDTLASILSDDFLPRANGTTDSPRRPPEPASQQRRAGVLSLDESLRTSYRKTERQRPQSPAPTAQTSEQRHPVPSRAPSWARGLFWADASNERCEATSVVVIRSLRPSSGWFWAETARDKEQGDGRGGEAVLPSGGGDGAKGNGEDEALRQREGRALEWGMMWSAL